MNANCTVFTKAARHAPGPLSLLPRALRRASALLFFAVGLPACSDGYQCGSQSVGGKPVEGCTELFSCDYATCRVEFSDCGGDTPSIFCEGSSCTCFDGDEEIGSCDYEPSQCPFRIDIQLDGDDTEAITFFETCCGADISSK